MEGEWKPPWKFQIGPLHLIPSPPAPPANRAASPTRSPSGPPHWARPRRVPTYFEFPSKPPRLVVSAKGFGSRVARALFHSARSTRRLELTVHPLHRPMLAGETAKDARNSVMVGEQRHREIRRDIQRLCDLFLANHLDSFRPIQSKLNIPYSHSSHPLARTASPLSR